MWILIGITIGVYLFLYAAETVWNFAVISPADLHAEQVKVNSAQVEQIEALKEVWRVKFDFRLHAKPGEHTSMEMLSGSTAYRVAVPFVGVEVSNQGERHIEVVACHFSKPRTSDSNIFRADKYVDPKNHAEVDVTTPLIQFVAGLQKPDFNKIFGSYQVEVSVECRAERDAEPIKSGPKRYDVEINGTGKMALDIVVSPARA